MPNIAVFQAAAQGAIDGLEAVIILPRQPREVWSEFRGIRFVNSLSQEAIFGLK